MYISQIYPMIQGELPNVGKPMIMVRLQGCNVGCTYCDSPYAQEVGSGVAMSNDEICQKVSSLNWNIKWVDISGGEPLLQRSSLKDLVELLHRESWSTEIETSGAYEPPDFRPTTFVVDWKMPGSGAKSRHIDDWLKCLTGSDCIKMVVSNEEDLKFILKQRQNYRFDLTKAMIAVSPMMFDIRASFGCVSIGQLQTTWNRRVSEFCQENGFSLNLQQHKFIWGKEKTDV